MKPSPFRLALAVTTALAGAAPAFAQDIAPGDIVVTARRVEERLQDVPISITVFNQQAISDRNVTNAQDLANYTPSLSATTSYGAENSTYAIRGFVQDTGTGPSVGVYFADVVAPRGPSQGFPAGDGAGPGAFFDLQNVQVLKGPQGTLFGRNTTGGAVLLVPRKPTAKFEGYVEGSIGNYDMRRVQGVINIPLAETFRARIGADYQKRDGYAINGSGVGPRDFDDIGYISVRGSVVGDLTPNLENYTIFSLTNSRNNGHVAKLFACNPTQDPANALGLQSCDIIAQQDAAGFYHLRSDMPDPYAKLRQWQVINTTTWQASDTLTIKNIASYAELRTRIRSALFGTNFFLGPFPVGFAVVRHLPNGYSSNQSTFTEELQFQGRSSDGALTWQAGAYYEDSRPIGFIGSQSPVFIGCSDPDNLVCTDLTGRGVVNYTAAKNTFLTRGLYAQATYALSERFKLTGGIRYTWDKVRSISRQTSYRFPLGVPDAASDSSFCTRFLVTAPPLCELDMKASFHKPTWLLGLDYTPTPDMLLYAKYARGYRTGGIKSDVPTEFMTFSPEKVDTFEIGAKTSFTGALRGTFNIAAFYNDFSNQQIQLGFNQNPASPISVTPTAGPYNVGKSRIWGIELDARLNLFAGFALDGGYTYLNTKVKEVIVPTLPASSPYVVSGPLVPGDELTLSPRHKLTVTGTYTLPLDESLGKVSVSLTYSYSSRQRTTYALRDPAVSVFFGGRDIGVLQPRNLFNANLNWNRVAGSPVDLSAFVTNLTNDTYYSHVNGLFPSVGFDTATLGEPRMYGLRLRYSFGGE